MSACIALAAQIAAPTRYPVDHKTVIPSAPRPQISRYWQASDALRTCASGWMPRDINCSTRAGARRPLRQLNR